MSEKSLDDQFDYKKVLKELKMLMKLDPESRSEATRYRIEKLAKLLCEYENNEWMKDEEQ